MPININQEGKVYAIAEIIRSLNNLSEKQLHVRVGSWYEIFYEGDLNALTLPEGYYVSTCNERGTVRECITNRGNTGDNSYWLYVFRKD